MRQRLQIVKVRDDHSSPVARVEDAIAAIRAGKMVIVVDDEDRENKGDLTIAAQTLDHDCPDGAVYQLPALGKGPARCLVLVK